MKSKAFELTTAAYLEKGKFRDKSHTPANSGLASPVKLSQNHGMTFHFADTFDTRS